MYGYFSSAVNAKSHVKHPGHDLSTRQVLPKVCPLPFHLLVHLDAPFQREPSPLHRPRPLQKSHGFVLVPGSPWPVSCGCSINSQMVSIAFRRKTPPLGLACIGGGGAVRGLSCGSAPPSRSSLAFPSPGPAPRALGAFSLVPACGASLQPASAGSTQPTPAPRMVPSPGSPPRPQGH